ncbi:MarR family transcriptional regulator [Prevotella sp. E13-17]|uniref:MarR family winged helix-turn-helix transcriptional regulator n=1 Tax=Prevotella sp. E13-17 TaxID=2913616 RepID=UPI001ED9ED7F|nr:MarR family transcriptional regulator [Prevotella sp. E13-17]UKK52191.1 MarR family transcriptional regulator [Prevotella sp. E13-17]
MHAELQLKNQICFRLYTAARLITQAYTPMFSTMGITYPQYLVLMVLWENDSQPVNDIARRLLLETNTVTPLLQRMEKQGLVIRQRGKEDKRQQIVSLTEKGRDMEEQAIRIIPTGMSEEMSMCPLKLEDYQRLAEELDAIIDTLKK